MATHRAEKVTFACMAPAVLRTVLDTTDRGDVEVTTRPRFVVALSLIHI